MDFMYTFIIDPKKDFDNQKISKKAYAMIVLIYIKFWANTKQKEAIQEFLRLKEKN